MNKSMYNRDAGFVENRNHSLFSYPALNEGDFLTLLAFEKYEISNYISTSIEKITDFSIEKVVEAIEVGMNWRLKETNTFTSYSVYVFVDEHGIFQILCIRRSRENEDYIKLYIQYYTHLKGSTVLFKKLDKLVVGTEFDSPKVTWVTSSQHGICTNVLAASKNRDVKDCFYPYIPEGVDQFYDDYDNSESPILILLGPPGTGKTSLIRNYMYKRNKKVLISYDHRLMASDDFFLFFLLSP